MDPWTLLGIAPTADVAAIRRAYARQLKLTRPDEDADSFQRLVSARDAALGDAAAIADPSPEDDIAPARAVADRIDAVNATQDAAEPAEVDSPAIVIREVGEPAATPASAPIPRIVVTDGNGDAAHRDGFWLEASERHWALARQMASDARRLLSSARAPDEELARLIDASATLPRGPRQEVEAAFIEGAGRDLRLPNGRFDRIRVEQVRAIFTRA